LVLNFYIIFHQLDFFLGEITVNRTPAYPYLKPEELEGTSEMNLQNIIESPNNIPLPVINRPALYVREEYKDIYHLLINNSLTGSHHKLVVTGTSGVGKSCFLIYFLIRLLYECENITIIFQSHKKSQKFYCFYEDSVTNV